jgi:hypothetical protein
MKKRDRIIYWVATIWLALGMLSTGVVQVLQVKEQIDPVIEMGYPAYFLIILGIFKILGVIILLIPKFLLLKEWAYAGFFFTMLGAVSSHIALNAPIVEIAPALLLLILTLVSWYFRPADRKIVSVHQKM